MAANTAKLISSSVSIPRLHAVPSLFSVRCITITNKQRACLINCCQQNVQSSISTRVTVHSLWHPKFCWFDFRLYAKNSNIVCGLIKLAIKTKTKTKKRSQVHRFCFPCCFLVSQDDVIVTLATPAVLFLLLATS